jgi:DMSO/TMAO reductase YedYZ heme-binding membrane subunit
VPATVGRSHGRQGVHAGAQGPAGDHMRKIVLTMVAVTAVIVLVLVTTKTGRDIDAATQRFMLFYAGVFALIGLTGSVLAGLLATDRIIMTPGNRVMAQAVHRAMSFGALAFLIIHIVTEILAQRAHVIDAVIPFLSPYRTFYIGLGTIASDLILLIVVTSILRRRFTGHGAAWRWRAIHYSAYAAFVFGVLHGLLGGRAAKPYVDWSYGFAIALTAIGLAVRFLVISLRPKESLSTPPGGERGRAANGSPLHAAAMSLAQSQLGGNPVQVLPPALAARAAAAGQPDTGAWNALPPVQAWSVASGPQPALISQPSAEPPAYATQATPSAYYDLGFTPLGAPYADDASAGLRARPYIPAELPAPALPAAAPVRQPMYEPGYEGPLRFQGAPRGHGDVPQDELSSYPYGPAGARPQASALPPASPLPPASYEGPTVPRRAIAGPANPATGPMPRPGTGPMPRLGTGPMLRAAGGPQPRPATGPLPRVDPSGSMRRLDPGPAGPGPQPRTGTGWFSRTDSGPMPRAGSGPMPRAGSGPMPEAGSGPYPRMGSGPMPQAGSGPLPRAGSGPAPQAASGPYRQLASGPMPRADSGPMPRANSGPYPRFGSGPMPQAGSGGYPQFNSGPRPRLDSDPHPRSGSGPAPRTDTGSFPRADHGPMPGTGTGSFQRVDPSGPLPGTGTGSFPRADSGPASRAEQGRMPESGSGSWPRPDTGPMPRPDTGPVPRVGINAWWPERGPDQLSDPDRYPRRDPGPLPRHARGPAPRPDAALAARPDTGPGPRMGPGPQTGPLPRAARQANPDDPRYREAPGRNGGNEWR